MALTAEATTTLEAINVMLTMIGEREVSALPSDDADVALILPADIAEKTLHRVSREVQSAGYEFNTEREVEITADGSGFLNIDTDVIKIDATDTTKRYVRRGAKVFNAEPGENTFVFTVGEVVEFDLVRMLDFTDLPQTARRYILIKAARVLIKDFLRDTTLWDSHGKEELDAKIAFDDEEWQVGETNMFQNYDSFMIVDREARPQGHNRAIINGFID